MDSLKYNLRLLLRWTVKWPHIRQGWLHTAILLLPCLGYPMPYASVNHYADCALTFERPTISLKKFAVAFSAID
jgi:hypothetical protein